MEYNISHDEIKESILDHIIKIIPDYILHEQPIDNEKETMNDEETIGSDDDEESMDEKETIDNAKSMDGRKTIDKEETINSLKQPTITMINNILKEPSINNKELLISDTLMINNDQQCHKTTNQQ